MPADIPLLKDTLIRCKTCDVNTWHKNIVRAIGPHYGESICCVCNNRTSFLKKPNNLKSTIPIKVFGDNFCQTCLRNKAELPTYETLETHHIIERQHGGSEDPSNLIVLCKYCHTAVHQLRNQLKSKLHRKEK